MFTRSLLAAFLLLGTSGTATAQDAAETAIILGATGTAQGKAQRSLGSAIAGSIGAAASAVRQGRVTGNRAPRGNPRSARQMILLPGDVDPLETTDAPTYRLSNGASIRVSRGLQQAPTAQPCEGDCADR